MTEHRVQWFRVGKVFLGKRCACGNVKNKHHWSCLECKAKLRNEQVMMELTTACNAHLEAVQNYLRACEANQIVPFQMELGARYVIS